jgi:uncharacterized protein YndB with AHSA1/START domain
MPPTEIHIDASPERVWEELALPATYEHWVVGSRTIESWDPEFPAPGAKFAHTQGKAPFVIRDETIVVACDAPRRLELLVKARPLLEAQVILELHPDGSGTRVVMDELPLRGLMALPIKLPPGRALTRARNTEALRRVKKRAEGNA